jgi:hypothetical protein
MEATPPTCTSVSLRGAVARPATRSVYGAVRYAGRDSTPGRTDMVPSVAAKRQRRRRYSVRHGPVHGRTAV